MARRRRHRTVDQHHKINQMASPMNSEVDGRLPHRLGEPSGGGGGNACFSNNVSKGSMGVGDDSDTQLLKIPFSTIVGIPASASEPAQKQHQQGAAFEHLRCDICVRSFNSTECLERHKTGKKHKRYLNKQRKIPTSDDTHQTPIQMTEQKLEGETQSPKERQPDIKKKAKRERRLLKVKYNKEFKMMRYFNPPVHPQMVQQPRCCMLCHNTYTTKHTFEKHTLADRHISRVRECEDEHAVYGLLNVEVAPGLLRIFRDQLPMFYGLKTCEMLQQEARGEAVACQYDWRPRDKYRLTIIGGALDNANLDSEDQDAALESNEKAQTEFASEIAMSGHQPLAVPEYDVFMPGLGAEKQELRNRSDLHIGSADRLEAKEQTGIASEIAMFDEAPFTVSI